MYLLLVVFFYLSNALSPRKPSPRTLSPVMIPKRALVVIAHPDDAVDTSGGTIYNWAWNHGAEVTYLILTNGDKGYHGPLGNMTSKRLAEIRQEEEMESASVLGVPYFRLVFGGLEDGCLDTYDPNAVRKMIVEQIRKVQPEVVLTFSPYIDFAQYKNGKVHHDHQRAGYLTLGSVYPMARDPLAFPDLKLPVWDTPLVYLFQWDENIDVYQSLDEDHCELLSKKTESYSHHRSQYGTVEELSLYVNQTARDVADAIGIGVEFAEGFQVVEFMP